jgi:hypothetical protein
MEVFQPGSGTRKLSTIFAATKAAINNPPAVFGPAYLGTERGVIAPLRI